MKPNIAKLFSVLKARLIKGLHNALPHLKGPLKMLAYCKVSFKYPANLEKKLQWTPPPHPLPLLLTVTSLIWPPFCNNQCFFLPCKMSIHFLTKKPW